jgi:hypothetical protein
MDERPATPVLDTLADELRLQAWLAGAELRHPSLTHPVTRAEIDLLVRARDELRVQAHLGRMDAADALLAAEPHWRSLQHAVDRAVADVGHVVDEALRAIGDAYRQATGRPAAP